MLLASENPLDHLNDQAWPFDWAVQHIDGMTVTVMSRLIATMILVALLLVVFIIPVARRFKQVPSGRRNVVEVLVVFVRDLIAKPALHEKAYAFLPLLCTMFVFVLGMNLLGMVPLDRITHMLHLPPVGGTPTALLGVTGALAAITFCVIIGLGLRHSAHVWHEHHHWPMPLCLALSPFLWLKSLAPTIPGVAGKVLLLPMIFLEFVGVVAKCGALMIRLFANMLAGHTLLAVLLMLLGQAVVSTWGQSVPQSYSGWYVSPAVVFSSVALNLLELLVAVVQAYIFTFLSAMFIGLYAAPSH